MLKYKYDGNTMFIMPHPLFTSNYNYIMKEKIKYTCPYCGSDNIVLDATAVWHIETQEWILCDTFDEFTCNDCDNGFRIANKMILE